MSQILYQVIATIILQYNTLLFGLTSCVPIATLLLFESENTTLDRPMTMTEISLFASLSRIGCLISTPFIGGYLLDKIGRKRCCILLSCISVAYWLILIFTRKVEIVIFSVLVAGFTGPMYLLVAIYVGEIAQESIRGRLTSCNTVSHKTGILTGFLIQGFFEYQTMIYLGATLAVLGTVMLCFLKESPTILMKKGLEKAAIKSIAFYRNSKTDSKVVQDALEKIRKTLTPMFEEMTAEEEKLNAEGNELIPAQKLSQWEFFKQSESTRRAFYLNLFLFISSIFQGMVVVQTYVKQIFHEAVPEDVLSSTWCSALMSVVGIVFGFVAAYMTDRFGRRTLMINASIATGFFHLCLGSQIQLSWGPPWLSALFVYLYCVAFVLGPGNIPFMVVAELYVPEIKGAMSTIIFELNWLLVFLALLLFNPLVIMIGMGPVFYIFAVCSFGSAVVCYFIQPETKGLSIDEIQKLFVSKKE